MNEQHTALTKFSYQINYALTHYKKHGFKSGEYRNIVIGGLGGSGIGGRIARSLFTDWADVPIECVADYTLPAYVNEHTLVILNSYSGNTEETLSAWEDARERKSGLVIITGGGQLLKLAKDHQVPFNEVEPGFQPRMALGFSLTNLILVLAEYFGRDVNAELGEIATLLLDPKVYQEEAKVLFESMKSKLKSKLVVLTDPYLEPIGLRFAQQINENAKHECFQHTLPEMNHNVIESYYGQLDSIFILIDSHRNSRISARFEFLSNLLEVEYNKVIHIPMDDSSLKSIYELIHLLDWLSLYIADFRKVDSLNVPNIVSLKEFLETAS